jgi:hypothetical protein
MSSNHYILDDRGYMWIYHWMVYILGGLRRIESVSPVKIFINNCSFPTINGKNYHSESLEIISDAYTFEEPAHDSEKINHHGEPLILADSVDPETYPFLRSLFLSRLPKWEFNGKKYYVTRNKCDVLHLANRGKPVRQVLNESEFYEDLIKLGYDIIQFEDYSFTDKIRIFQTASVIVAPIGGALVFSLFATDKTTIVEIIPSKVNQHDHYKNICDKIGINYKRYTDNVTVIGTPSLNTIWNMNVSTNKFIEYISSI